MLLKIFLICAVHIIGGIFMFILCCKNGAMEYAALHGDGVRWSKPCGLIVDIFLIWEFILCAEIIEIVSNNVNHYFYNRYCNDNDCHQNDNDKTHWIFKEDE